jgi:hypothetical protein
MKTEARLVAGSQLPAPFRIPTVGYCCTSGIAASIVFAFHFAQYLELPDIISIEQLSSFVEEVVVLEMVKSVKSEEDANKGGVER